MSDLTTPTQAQQEAWMHDVGTRVAEDIAMFQFACGKVGTKEIRAAVRKALRLAPPPAVAPVDVAELRRAIEGLRHDLQVHHGYASPYWTGFNDALNAVLALPVLAEPQAPPAQETTK